MFSCPLFGQLSFPNDKSVLGKGKNVLVIPRKIEGSWTRRLCSRRGHWRKSGMRIAQARGVMRRVKEGKTEAIGPIIL
jgi:hypothetical protein